HDERGEIPEKSAPPRTPAPRGAQARGRQQRPEEGGHAARGERAAPREREARLERRAAQVALRRDEEGGAGPDQGDTKTSYPSPPGRGGRGEGRPLDHPTTFLDREPPEILQALAVGARERQPRPVLERHRVVAVEPGVHVPDALDVHDRRAVDPEEVLRIE